MAPSSGHNRKYTLKNSIYFVSRRSPPFIIVNSIVNVITIVKGVDLGGLVVSVLATGPKVRGFDPDRGRWIFKGDKKSGTPLPSEGK
jgi:hypothetical protein